MPVKAELDTYQDLQEILAKIPKKELRQTQLFVEGDHWQGGACWHGWRPESNSRTAMYQWRLVEGLFNSKNVCGGMVKRVMGAILGKEPDWQIIAKKANDELPPPPPPVNPLNPTPVPVKVPELTPEEKFWKDIDAQVSKWWDSKKVHKALKTFIHNRAAYGKAAIRIYIPAGYLTQSGSEVKLKATSFEEVLNRIYIDVPGYECAIDAYDPEYGDCYTIVEQPRLKPEDQPIYEVNYLDEDRKTWIRRVGETETGAIGIDLGGYLLTYIDGEYKQAMISDSIKRQQMAVNHAKTGENFALENINFPEVTFINANLPVEKVKDASGQMVDVPKEMHQGPGRWRSIFGVMLESVTGGQTITDPKIYTRENADPQKFAQVADNNTRDMHQEAGMLYLYLADSEYASGTAKVESMTDYLILLVDYKTIDDTMGMWLLNTVPRLALALSGQSDKMDQFDVVFSSKITIGRISNDDKKTMMDEVSKGLRSKRSYMVVAEVADDPNSELKVIAADGPLKDTPPPPIITPPAPSPNGGPKPSPVLTN